MLSGILFFWSQQGQHEAVHSPAGEMLRQPQLLQLLLELSASEDMERGLRSGNCQGTGADTLGQREIWALRLQVVRSW